MPRSLRNAEIKGFVPLDEKERIDGRCLFLILNQEGYLKRRDSAKKWSSRWCDTRKNCIQFISELLILAFLLSYSITAGRSKKIKWMFCSGSNEIRWAYFEGNCYIVRMRIRYLLFSITYFVSFDTVTFPWRDLFWLWLFHTQCFLNPR